MPSLAEIALQNRLAAGDSLPTAMRNTGGVCAFVWSWAKTTRELGRRPTQAEHAKYWKVSRPTAEREVARFKETFPGVELQQLADWLNTHELALVRSKAKALSLPAPDFIFGQLSF